MSLNLRFRPWRASRPDERHRSVWIEQAFAREPGWAPRVLEGEQRADVCIVGGGFTGLWTAHRLRDLDPTLRIAIVEADACGSGASGRNSGAMGHWWTKLPALVRMIGAEDAQRVLRASIAILDDMHAFIGEHRIDCELRRVPSVWSATSPASVGAWNGVFRAAESLGLTPPYRVLSKDELRSMFGQGPYLAGVVEEGVTRLQPALLARGLRAAAIARGVEIFEGSPVSSIEGSANAITVHAGRGRIVADKLVLAANAWMAHLPEFKPSVVVVSSDIVITDPIPDLLDRFGMRNRPGGVNSRLMLNYGGLTPDGRVYVGRGGGTLAYDAHPWLRMVMSTSQPSRVSRRIRRSTDISRNCPLSRRDTSC